uniref:Alanine--glyoxylate aminotransferase 2, mitochondrial n=1 Tax=Strigamia maritima TaxID=126957 RepID=T1JJ22_STRMM
MQKHLLQGIRWYSKIPELPASNFKPRKYAGLSYEELMKIRKTNLQPGILTFYNSPVLISQGHMQYLFDNRGKRYLDMFAGIVTVSVGHCHPYINRVCFFTNSGSEANDLAMMLARLHTGNFDLISLRNSYHGGSPYAMGLTGTSRWKHNFPNGFGIHHVINPDVYRGIWGGKHCRDSPVQTDRTCSCNARSCDANQQYINQLHECLLYSAPSQKVAGIFVEPIQGIGGIVQYPKNYAKLAFELIRKHGGICIADEVQTGFGRTGDHFWGFESHGVVPDIVTMAKGVANGFPMGAVVTTPQIAKSLHTALQFNTFGGNPIACTVASAVLDVIENENLQENSRRVGGYLLEKLSKLRDEFEIVGDVRGKGLMIGMELVVDKKSKIPLDAEKMMSIWENCKDMELLVGKGGFYGNVFRIQPPMCITLEDADFCVDVFRKALSTF